MTIRSITMSAATALFAGAVCHAAQQEPPKAQPTTSQPAQPESKPAGQTAGTLENPLKVTISAAPSQKTKDGLLFNLEVMNVSTSPMSFYDPSDVMDISLVGDEGYPSALPPVPSMLEIKTSDPAKTRELLDQQRAFTVVPVPILEIREGTKTLVDRDKAGEIHLKPGERFLMSARITKTLADAAGSLQAQKDHAPDPKGAPPAPATKPIPVDRYKVRVLIPFVSKGKSMGRFLISNEVKTSLTG